MFLVNPLGFDSVRPFIPYKNQGNGVAFFPKLFYHIENV
jgi:hypothetical protein